MRFYRAPLCTFRLGPKSGLSLSGSRRIVRKVAVLVLVPVLSIVLVQVHLVLFGTSTVWLFRKSGTFFNENNIAPATVAPLSDEQDAWLNFTKYFKARNPEYQSWCELKLGSSELSPVGSQFQQDVFLMRNVFSSQILQGTPGFYIDSGANEPETLSNTLFFDVCLGWSGLCIEPNEQYHAALIEKRSCQLCPLCISDKEENTIFSATGGSGHIGEGANQKTIRCAPLDVILDKYANGRRHIDFWSLDVEGHEMTVLEAVPWSKFTFTALLVETFWLSDRIIDRFMTELGYAKIQQLAIDSLYMKWNAARSWRPSYWDEHWRMNEEFRDAMREQGKLSKKH